MNPSTAPELIRQIRQHLHHRFIASIESDPIAKNDDSSIGKRLSRLAEKLQAETGVALNEHDREIVCEQVFNDVQGMGPLTELMKDPSVTDILVNGAHDVWVDRDGRLKQTDLSFDDEAHLRRFVDRFIAAQGKHLDSSTPTVDSRLPDGSRMHVVIPPLSLMGTVVSIRRFRDSHSSLANLIDSGMLSRVMADLLICAVQGGINIVIAGGAGAGKTTLLNAISEYIPAYERVITVEESAELSLRHNHVVKLEGRQGNSEGKGKIDLRTLVRNALRMRADRIIVGEVRGDEVFDMLQAMNVGHDGSLTTVHANNPQQVLKRLETLGMLADGSAPREAIRGMIGSAVQLIVQVARFSDGSRRVTSICEVQDKPDESEVVEIFRIRKTVVASTGYPQKSAQPVGEEHTDCGIPPRFLEQIRAKGYGCPSSLSALWHLKEPE